MRVLSKFFVAEHHATRAKLHYDLRFKIPSSGMWASFACRKEIPMSTGQKILAVRTKDHTSKEAKFTGKIPEGEYGAGTIKKWDSGSCVIEKYSTAHIAISFKGSKLKGMYHLVSIKLIQKKKAEGSQYLLFKGKES